MVERVRKRAAQKHQQKLLVSTSEAGLLSSRQWSHNQIDSVFSASDFVLLHGGDGIDHGQVGDRTEVAKKIDFIRSRSWFVQRPRPIVFNESDGELAFESAVKRGVSFGLHSSPYFQTMWPPRWGVWKNETLWFFHKARELTGASGTELD